MIQTTLFILASLVVLAFSKLTNVSNKNLLPKHKKSDSVLEIVTLIACNLLMVIGTLLLDFNGLLMALSVAIGCIGIISENLVDKAVKIASFLITALCVLIMGEWAFMTATMIGFIAYFIKDFKSQWGFLVQWEFKLEDFIYDKILQPIRRLLDK